MEDTSKITEKVKNLAFNSIKWVIAGDFMRRLITPLTTVILARLLSPTDYGIVGIATLVLALVNTLQDLGLGAALVQRPSIEDSTKNVVFWSNLFSSSIVFSALMIFVPLIASIFDEPRVVPVIRLMSFMVIFNAFGAIQMALLKRNFRFKNLFWLQSIPAITQLAIAIPLAMLGFEYWSLVWASFLGALLQNLFVWQQSTWRPRFFYDIKTAVSLFAFGGFVTVESLQSWLLNYGDKAILGHSSGVANMGVYVLGFSISSLLFGLIINPLLPVAYSTFSRLQNNKEELGEIYLKIVKIIASVCFPIAVGLIITSKPLVIVVFGDKWTGLEYVICFMAIMNGINYLWQFNPDLYRAVGKPEIMPKFYLAMLIYGAPALWLAASHGLFAFSLTRCAVETVMFPAQVLIVKKLLGLSNESLWNCIRSPLIASSIMGLAVYPLTHVMYPFQSYMGGVKLGTIIIFGIGCYALALFTIDRERIMLLRTLAQKIVAK